MKSFRGLSSTGLSVVTLPPVLPVDPFPTSSLAPSWDPFPFFSLAELCSRLLLPLVLIFCHHLWCRFQQILVHVPQILVRPEAHESHLVLSPSVFVVVTLSFTERAMVCEHLPGKADLLVSYNTLREQGLEVSKEGVVLGGQKCKVVAAAESLKQPTDGQRAEEQQKASERAAKNAARSGRGVR